MSTAIRFSFDFVQQYFCQPHSSSVLRAVCVYATAHLQAGVPINRKVSQHLQDPTRTAEDKSCQRDLGKVTTDLSFQK